MDHSKPSSFMKNAHGFTLFEVMIAITILSFISFATFKMVDTNTETKERVIKEDRQTVQGLTAIGRLDSDISQLYNPLFSHSKLIPTADNSADIYADTNTNANGAYDGKANNGALIPQFKSEDKSSIIFLTMANRRKFTDSKESRLAWVKYSLRAMEPDPDNPDDKSSGLYELVRQTIASDIYNSNLDWSKPKFQVVMEDIKELEFSFWDERTKKYVDSLQGLNENKNLIRSLKVSIKWIDEDKNEQKLEKTFRVLNPYFNTKQDDLKSGALGGSGGSGSQGGGANGSQSQNPDQAGAEDDS